MLTTTIVIAVAYLCFADALAGFDCESPKDLGCTGSNALHGCCKECIAQIVEDKKKIDNWVSTFKSANPGMSAAQIDKYESPDRLDWGHPNLKNCFFCAGQCWNNPDDNTACQVSQADPFGSKSKRAMTPVKVTKVMRHPEYAQHYPQLAAANKTGIEAFEEVAHGKRNVEAMCGAAEQSELTLIIPGFGKRFHCDVNCLNQFASKAPTPAPTPHPGQIGEDHNPTPQPVFGEQTTTTTYGGVGVQTTKPGVVIINGTPVGGGNQQQSGVSCSKENEVCGMAGNTKLFCKCKVCGFKGDTCAGVASSLSFVAAAAALLAAAMRFL